MNKALFAFLATVSLSYATVWSTIVPYTSNQSDVENTIKDAVEGINTELEKSEELLKQDITSEYERQKKLLKIEVALEKEMAVELDRIVFLQNMVNKAEAAKSTALGVSGTPSEDKDPQGGVTGKAPLPVEGAAQ